MVFQQILNQSDISYLDLLEPFRSASSAEGPLYTFKETHWNLKGIRLAAGELENALLKANVLTEHRNGAR